MNVTQISQICQQMPNDTDIEPDLKEKQINARQTLDLTPGTISFTQNKDLEKFTFEEFDIEIAEEPLNEAVANEPDACPMDSLQMTKQKN